MEESLLLKQDPRLVSDLPDLPPGTENDFETKKVEKETSVKKSTRRSTSSKRKSPSHSRSRRSPTPTRRSRYRYSPERRGSRFDRRRSPPPRERYRGRGGRRGPSSSRSRSRSVSPANRRSGRSRWSPKKKPKTPTPPPNLPMPGIDASKMMMNTAPPPPNGQFNVMQAPPPPQLYSADAYAGYGQTYTAFGQQPNAYAANYNTAYATQSNWSGHDAYAQQGWIQNTVPNTNQMPPSQLPDPSSFPNSNVNQALVVPSGTSDSSAHDAAVAQEAENQRVELKKQRSSYIQKNSVLKKELKMLRDQRKDLDSGAAPPSPTTKGFIDENEKLQNQIIKKIATIDNVIEMLTGVIGEEHVEPDNTPSSDGRIQKSIAAINTGEVLQTDSRNTKRSQQTRTTSTSSNSTDGTHTSDSSSSSSTESSTSTDNEEDGAKKKANNQSTKSGATNVIKKQEDDDDDDSSPERLKHKVMESMRSKQRTLSATALKDFPSLAEKMKPVAEPEPIRFNYAFYDPEMHWCQKCNVFPKTAKDYLKHLHSKEHMDKENATETPWHANLVEDNFPTYENVQTKRMPIGGITFFAPAIAWYCKLCSAWMGDLHCASVHLKSKQHSSKYTAFLERNPNFEMNWLADRQRVLNEKNLEAAASQITAVSTTAAEPRDNRKSKKNDDKSAKKHKKNSDKKNKKKKKKQKKRKKVQDSTTDSSNSDSSSSEDAEEKHAKKKKKLQKDLSPIKDLDNPNPAASIRLTMRKTEMAKTEVDDYEPVQQPPPISMTLTNTNAKRPLGNWTLAQEGTGKQTNQDPTKSDIKSEDTIIQQWNSVQPVISDNEKKLLEQLKGKLKTSKTSTSGGKDSKDVKESDKFDGNRSRESRMERSYRGKRSRTRSPTRSRSRGRDWRRARSRSLRRRSRSRARRSRSRSRGRYSPIRGGRRRYSRSRSRRRRSRSRSRNRRNRRSRTRTRSGSRGSPSAALTSASRIEKPVVPHSEFRPRVPEKEKEKEKKTNDSKDKKETKKPAKATSTASTTGKKLPFIGKMPVFKKQATGQTELDAAEATSLAAAATTANVTDTTTGIFVAQTATPVAPPRPPAPTAEQIKMAMMEDVYGNAPPFHPDISVMHAAMDYEDLMPDPVQFVNLMSQAPPAPPPPIEDASDKADVLPPGIDENEMENEEFVSKPAPEGGENDAALPKDFEEALNIIFPGERKFDDENDENSQAEKEPAGETQIIVEQPVMQMDDLYKEGIHMVSIEETSIIAMDEASQLSMNEPLIFNNAAKTTSKHNETENNTEKPDKSLINLDHKSDDKKNMSSASSNNEAAKQQTQNNEQSDKSVRPPTPSGPDSIPMPPPPPTTESQSNECQATELNLDDIPHPPAPLSESEKQRRQEELDDLAMLGIDADDMAAQCM